MSNRPILARIGDALRAYAEAPSVAPLGEAQERAIVQSLMPGAVMPARAAATMVRAATPSEIKRSGAEVRRRGFDSHPVVHACIRVVSDIIASVPLVALRDRSDSETKVGPDHPLQQLLDFPAPRVTARQLRARFAVDFLGYGNSLWRITRAGNVPGKGRILTLRPINAEGIQNVWVDAEGDASVYAYSDWNGTVEQAVAADVIHFRDLDMPRPSVPDVFGYPRGAAALASIASDSEATSYVRQIVTNDGTPTFVVMMDEGVTVEDAKTVQDRYTERTVGRGKRGTPAFFGGVRDVKPLGFTLNDLEFPDLRRVSREDICAAFGVDPRMIGIASATNDAGLSGVQYAEARTRLVQHTIEPMLSAMCDELNAWLSPEFGNVWITPDHDVLRDLIENDSETSLRVRDEFKSSLRSLQESRRALKLPPDFAPIDSVAVSSGVQLVPAALAVMAPAKPGTEAEPLEPGAEAPAGPAVPADAAGAAAGVPTEDVAASAMNGAQVTALVSLLESLASKALPAATVRALIAAAFPSIPASLIEQMLGGMAGFTPAPVATPAAPGAAPAPADAEAEEEDEADGEELDGDPAEEEARSEAPLDPRYDQWRAAMDKLDADEVRYRTAALARFRAERTSVVGIFKKAARGNLSRADSTFGDPILDEALRRALEGYAPGAEYHEAWADSYRKLVGNTYLTGASDAVSGASFNFSLQSQSVQDAIERRVLRLADFVTDETSRQITAAVRAGELGGLSVEEIANLISAAVFGEPMTDTRATRIARTESAGAMSQGGWDQAAEAGIYRSKEWLAFEDGKTRETHLGCMSEGRIAIDQPFGANGLQYPLDPAGDAAEVINCRCTLLYYDEEAP